MTRLILLSKDRNEQQSTPQVVGSIVFALNLNEGSLYDCFNSG